MEGRVPPPMDWWVLGPPVQPPLLDINDEKPPVTIIVEKQKIIFLLDSEACFSVSPVSPSPQSNNKVIIRGISGQPLEHYFTWPLLCSWGDLHFCHSFLIVPETPVPLLGWDLPPQLKAQILLSLGDYLCCPFLQEQVDPTVWWAKIAFPIQIKFKDPSQFPHQEQYPLKSEGQQDLLPIINSLKKKGLLISYSSTYNSPILVVQKGPDKWRLVQDLINEAVIPLHPIIPNPYILLAQIPSKVQYYPILDLKDAFFCIPVHPDSQPLFAFKDPTNLSQQQASQFMVLLEQPMELDSLGTTSGWPPFYAPSNTPVWALYNKCSLQIHISTSPMDQIPALSRGIFTSAYGWALHPVLSGASGDNMGQPLRQVTPHLPPLSPLSPAVVGYLSQRADLLGLGT
jgi:hypothetical protein